MIAAADFELVGCVMSFSPLLNSVSSVRSIVVAGKTAFSASVALFKQNEMVMAFWVAKDRLFFLIISSNTLMG